MTWRRLFGAHRLVVPVVLVTFAVTACSSGTKRGAAVSSTTPASSVPDTRPANCAPPQIPPGTSIGTAEIHWTAGCIPYVRTPDERFARLVNFPYSPHYALVDGLRMAYEDEGPRNGQVVLLLHGEPSWSYLYRKMIPILVDGGYRVIAPDMIGMGRSDKPVEFRDYSYLKHVRWVEEFIRGLGLRNITAFVQDWGSLIGLRVIGDHPAWFARVVVANGRLPVVPEGLKLITLPNPPLPNNTITLPFGPGSRKTAVPHFGVSDEFAQWAVFALTGTHLRASAVVNALTATKLSPPELAAYDAPFPSRIYMTGVRVFPSLINTIGDPPTNAAARKVFNSWTKPLLTLFGRLDHNLGTDAVQAELRDTVPGAKGQLHHAYTDANHFIQEDKGADLARRVVAFMKANPIHS